MAVEDPGIRVELDATGIQHVVIDRPEVGNSLSPGARDALTAAFTRAHHDEAVRAVLLSSVGAKHFCTGAGLPTRPTSEPAHSAPQRRPGDIAQMLKEGWQRLVASILDCDKPVVAAVRGTAAGAGASLVLACDLVVMSDEATLVEAFVNRGIMPDSGAIHLLTRIVGLRKATELLMLGEPLTAAVCAQLGLVNRVVVGDDVEDVAAGLAARLAAGPSVMLALTKRLLAVSSESSRHRAFEREAWAAEVVARTADLQEGLRSFAERRAPRFEGR